MKVLGKLPDDQINSFYKTPRFNGVKLPEIPRPETLEKRYTGKLSKVAINFMKTLLSPDPVTRLKGDAVFQHPFFDSFKQETSEILNNKSALHIFNNNQMEGNNNSARTENTASEQKLKKPYNSNNNVLSNMPSINETATKTSGFNSNHQPIINNTTNINIINYNYDEGKKPKEDMKKSEETKKNMNNMVLTTLNFPKNYKENLLNMYGGTNFDSNFKTFYKNDKYNYEIDLNFKNQKKPKLLSIDEEDDHHEPKQKSKSYPKQQIKPNQNKVKNIELGADNDYNRMVYKTKKPVEKVYQKNSPAKYPSYNNTKGNLNINNFGGGINYNLPNITLKNFKIKN